MIFHSCERDISYIRLILCFDIQGNHAYMHIVIITCSPLSLFGQQHTYRVTMYTEHEVLRELHLNLGNSRFPDVVSYNHFRLSWYSYLNLLDIDYSIGFRCNRCGDQPQILIIDATSLAFRKALDTWHSHLFQSANIESHGKIGR